MSPGLSQESRFSSIIQPLKDLAASWDIDIASTLEEYLNELEEIHISIKSDLNFAEAALLIQGSTMIYSRKVECLYDLVFKALDAMSARSSEKNGRLSAREKASRTSDSNANSSSNSNRSDVFAFGEDDDPARLLLDDDFETGGDIDLPSASEPRHSDHPNRVSVSSRQDRDRSSSSTRSSASAALVLSLLQDEQTAKALRLSSSSIDGNGALILGAFDLGLGCAVGNFARLSSGSAAAGSRGRGSESFAVTPRTAERVSIVVSSRRSSKAEHGVDTSALEVDVGAGADANHSYKSPKNLGDVISDDAANADGDEAASLIEANADDLMDLEVRDCNDSSRMCDDEMAAVSEMRPSHDSDDAAYSNGDGGSATKSAHPPAARLSTAPGAATDPHPRTHSTTTPILRRRDGASSTKLTADTVMRLVSASPAVAQARRNPFAMLVPHEPTAPRPVRRGRPFRAPVAPQGLQHMVHVPVPTSTVCLPMLCGWTSVSGGADTSKRSAGHGLAEGKYFGSAEDSAISLMGPLFPHIMAVFPDQVRTTSGGEGGGGGGAVVRTGMDADNANDEDSEEDWGGGGAACEGEGDDWGCEDEGPYTQAHGLATTGREDAAIDSDRAQLPRTPAPHSSSGVRDEDVDAYVDMDGQGPAVRTYSPLEDNRVAATAASSPGDLPVAAAVGNKSYEELCREHVRRFLSGAARGASESQAAARVREWTERLEPQLAEQDRRPPFDMGRYTGQFLAQLVSVVQARTENRLDTESEEKNEPAAAAAAAATTAAVVQNPTRVAGVWKGGGASQKGVQQHSSVSSVTGPIASSGLVSFRDVLSSSPQSSCPQYEVCRMFLACLQLANLGNLSIAPTASPQGCREDAWVGTRSGFDVKLVTAENLQNLEGYRAPSLNLE